MLILEILWPNFNQWSAHGGKGLWENQVLLKASLKFYTKLLQNWLACCFTLVMAVTTEPHVDNAHVHSPSGEADSLWKLF